MKVGWICVAFPQNGVTLLSIMLGLVCETEPQRWFSMAAGPVITKDYLSPLTLTMKPSADLLNQ